VASVVFFTGEIAQLQNTFLVNGSPTDPTTISAVITDPNGVSVTHTYGGASPADITRLSLGAYQLNITSATFGLWSYVWVGTGAASDIQAGTWTVQPTTVSQFYTSVEEIKDRLKITDTADDMSLTMSVQAATRWVERHCGRHFYQRTETRTYVPENIYELHIDDLVSLTAMAVDYDGDGVYETIWTQGTDFQVMQTGSNFNQYDSGELMPLGVIRAINFAGQGRYFPFIWPFSRLDRIQITGTWGWPAVPFAVRQATLQVAAEFYKLKDAPFGIAGASEFGNVRVPSGMAVALDLLCAYVHPRRAIGI
jgi:hypothetical protein